MATVEEILDVQIPDPTIVYSPTKAAPAGPDIFYDRPDQTSASSTARTLDPISKKYETRSEDVPTIQGKNQGIYIDGLNRTELMRNAANINPANTGWNVSDSDLNQETTASIVDGGTALKLKGKGTNDFVSEDTSSPMAAGPATCKHVFELNNRNNIPTNTRFRAYDRTENNTMAQAYVDLTKLDDYLAGNATKSELINGQTSATKNVGFAQITDDIYEVVIRFDPSDTSTGTDASGNTGSVVFHPDESTDGELTLHFAGLRNHGEFGEPIATSTTAITRARGRAIIRRDSFDFTPKGSTILLEFTPLFHQFGPNNCYWVNHLQGNLFYTTSVGLNTPPYDVTAFDGQNSSVVNITIEPFTVNRAALRIKPNNFTMAANGTVGSSSGGHNGDLLTDRPIRLAERDCHPTIFHSVKVIPGAITDTALQTITQV